MTESQAASAAEGATDFYYFEKLVVFCFMAALLLTFVVGWWCGGWNERRRDRKMRSDASKRTPLLPPQPPPPPPAPRERALKLAKVPYGSRQSPAEWLSDRMPKTEITITTIYIAPKTGTHFHRRENCGGLGKARDIRKLTPCDRCCFDSSG